MDKPVLERHFSKSLTNLQNNDHILVNYFVGKLMGSLGVTIGVVAM